MTFLFNKYRAIYGKIQKILFCRNIRGNGKIVSDRYTKLILSRTSVLELQNTLKVNDNSIRANKRSSIIRLDENAKMIISGFVSLFYGTDIVVFQDGILEIGNSFLNSDCKVRCHKHIKIGDGCAISHDCTIMDSDAHYINGDKHTKEVIIEDDVWIGTRVTILSGTRIGKGAVVAAGAVVKGNIPANSLVGGIPAKIIRENIEWSM